MIARRDHSGSIQEPSLHVVLVSIHPFPSPQAVSLAAACLKASLSKVKHLATKVSLSLQDDFVGHPAGGLVQDIISKNPDAVGFSMYIWNRAQCLEVATALRRVKPQLIIFAGGPEATADPEAVLSSSDLNFIIIGEGEDTFIETMSCLSEGRSLTGVAGIAYGSQGGFEISHRTPADTLDQLPSPYLSGALLPAEHGGVLWELSRGCSFACDFCFDHKGGAGVRSLSLERITRELQLFVHHRVSQVFVLDSTFNQDIKRAKTILRLIRKVAPHIHFHFEVRSEFMDQELANLFAQCTCSLQIGLQSADPGVLRKVGRVFNAEDFTIKIGFLNNAGAIFGFDLIYGLPGDTLAGFSASLEFALELYPNHVDIFPLAVLPATTLAKRATEMGLDWLPIAPYTVQSSATFSAADMEQAAKLAVACDIFYSRGKAVAWFKPVLQALKMNAISLLDAFALWLQSEHRATTAEEQLSDGQIWKLQRQFLQEIFTEKKKHKLLPLAHDLVDYHYYYATALLSPVPDLPTDRELERMNLLDEQLVLAPSAILAGFNYEIIDLLETGEVDLNEFIRCFKPAGSYAVIYPRAEEVFTESLIKPYYQLLTAFRSGGRARDAIKRLGISQDEACSFLEFAVAEGVVTLVSKNKLYPSKAFTGSKS